MHNRICCLRFTAGHDVVPDRMSLKLALLFFHRVCPHCAGTAAGDDVPSACFSLYFAKLVFRCVCLRRAGSAAGETIHPIAVVLPLQPFNVSSHYGSAAGDDIPSCLLKSV